MAIPSKLGPTDRNIAGLIGCLASYGRNADAVVQEAFFGASAAVGNNVTLVAVETQDTASLQATVVAGLPALNTTLAFVETPDTAVMLANLVSAATLAATENPDTAVFLVGALVSVVLSASESPDTALFQASVDAAAVLTAVEDPDIAVLFSTLQVAATLDATEAQDTALFQMDGGYPVAASAPLVGSIANTSTLLNRS